MSIPVRTTTVLLQRAIEIAVEAHNSHIDKAGHPYILHPLRVMFQQRDPQAMMVAVLHDVIEDTGLTLEALSRMGMPPDVIEAVDALTHRENEPYDAYLRRVRSNALALRVKRADMRDNMRLDRLVDLTGEEAMRLSRKYYEGWQLLEQRDERGG